MRLFVYDHLTLRPVVEQALGTQALRWYDSNYSVCARVPEQCMGFDTEFPDGWLQRELPLALQSRGAHFVNSPREADAILWLVWDYAFCVAAGTKPLEWERFKGRLTASCAAHVALIRWLHTTPAWKSSGGRNFVLVVDDPRRWQEALGRGVHIPWFMRIAKERYGQSAHEVETAAGVLSTTTRSAILVATEDRRAPEARGSSRLITMPYYCAPSFYRRGGAGSGSAHEAVRQYVAANRRNRPLLASFVGTVEVRNDCAVCENAFQPRDLRIKLADALSSDCGHGATPNSSETLLGTCKLVALDALRLHRDDRQGLAAAGVDFARNLLDATFCLIPRGDSASTKRFYASIQAGCVPVVISDHFMPAFASLVGSNQAMIHLAEADFLDPAFSLTRFLTLVREDGLDDLRRKGRKIRNALSYLHVRPSTLTPTHENVDSSSTYPHTRHKPDAVDHLATELLELLANSSPSVSSLSREPPGRPLHYERASSSPLAHPYMIFADERTGSTSMCWALDRHPQIKCDHELFKNEWACTELLHYVRFSIPRSGTCKAVLDNLGPVLERYWDRCSYSTCGGKVFPANLPAPRTVHDMFARNRHLFGARIIKLMRLNKHAQYASRNAARATGNWGSTPALRAVAAAKAHHRMKKRIPPPITNQTDFALFQAEQLAWQRQVEELRPLRHFLTIFTEELVGGGRLNKTTLNRIATFLGVRPYSPRLLHAMQESQRVGEKVSWRRFFKNASGVGN